MIFSRYQCFEDNYFVTYQYYAHRNMPSVFVQEIEVTNTLNHPIDVELVLPQISDWSSAVKQKIK